MPRNAVLMIARLSLFVIYFWFGLLKVIGLSPATPLVIALYHKIPVLNSMPFNTFYIAFGLFEIIIGILFLFPKWIKLASILFLLHMIVTALPLFVVPNMTWQQFLVPTLEGQYIIKNLGLIAIVLFLITDRRHLYV